MAEADKTKPLVAKLLLGVVGMFAFVFVVMVPLYNVLCDVTGLNGKTGSEAYTPVEAKVDTSRTIEVQFLAMNNDGMVWEFNPNDRMMKVHPGEAKNTSFLAKNPTVSAMVGQAIPSVSPSRAAAYFHKTECFCFEQQELAAGEKVDMPLQFIVDQDLPKDIKTITLSYTLFDVSEELAAK